MTWALLTRSAELSVLRVWAVPPDYWGQADIWIPSSSLGAFSGVTGNLFAVQSADSVGLVQSGPDWFLTNEHGGASSFPTPFTPDTTHTVKFHLASTGGTTGTVTWYLDGVPIGSYAIDATLGGLALGPFGFGSECCQSAFVTNVKLGSTEGGHDLFADDFSGGLSNWTVTAFGGSQVLVLDAPSDSPCPTLTVAPPRAQPGTTITLTGSGYTPGSQLGLFIGNTWISSFDVSADGSGNFTATVKVPNGPIRTGEGAADKVVVYDENGLNACSSLRLCGAFPSDGWRTDVDPKLATGGIENNGIYDYIFHDGAHWVLWRDPSTGSAASGSTFPPPANHTLNATRISADGSSVVDYPIDTGYNYSIAQPPNADSNLIEKTTCCCPTCGDCDNPIPCLDPRCNRPEGSTQYCITWSKIFWFQEWSKPVLDARFASDGTTLWVGVLTQEMIPDPWVNQAVFNMSDASTLISTREGAAGVLVYNPRFSKSQGLLDFCHDTAFPVTDGGVAQTGNWDPPRVRMFAGGEGGFALIGIMDAQFCPGSHDSPDICAFPGVAQTAPSGSFFSGISMAANPNEPGVCHLVWSEGGDWGTWGEACIDHCGCPHHAVWDAGPPWRDYRVGYSTWTPSAKAAEYDLFHSHIERQRLSRCDPGAPEPRGWYFFYGGADAVGYTWPPAEDFAAASSFQVVNDTGTPILFISFLDTAQNPVNIPPDGGEWLDYGVIGSEPTVRMYDISAGTATLLQVITPDLIPTEEEASYYYRAANPGLGPYAPNAVNGVIAYTQLDSSVGRNLPGIIERGLGVSLVYDDPLTDTPVFLVRVPWGRWDPATNFDPGVGEFDCHYPLQAFYRVPADGSAPFDFLDGERQVDFSIVEDNPTFRAEQFFSDPRNIWLPSPAVYSDFGHDWTGFEGEWFDRVCINKWTEFNESILAAPPFTFDPAPPAACPGFYYDPDSDIIYYCSLDLGSDLFQVTIAPICRRCLDCKCGSGVHIAHRV